MSYDNTIIVNHGDFLEGEQLILDNLLYFQDGRLISNPLFGAKSPIPENNWDIKRQNLANTKLQTLPESGVPGHSGGGVSGSGISRITASAADGAKAVFDILMLSDEEDPSCYQENCEIPQFEKDILEQGIYFQFSKIKAKIKAAEIA
ncbi:hypothetical protein DMENIID0001_001980 [Sergentomyia squamirostris]